MPRFFNQQQAPGNNSDGKVLDGFERPGLGGISAGKPETDPTRGIVNSPSDVRKDELAGAGKQEGIERNVAPPPRTNHNNGKQPGRGLCRLPHRSSHRSGHRSSSCSSSQSGPSDTSPTLLHCGDVLLSTLSPLFVSLRTISGRAWRPMTLLMPPAMATLTELCSCLTGVSTSTPRPCSTHAGQRCTLPP